MYNLLALTMIILFIFLTGCLSSQYPENKIQLFVEQSDSGNFHLQVGQESSIDPVPIDVYIDDNMVVSGLYFKSNEDTNEPRMPRYTDYERYKFNLSEVNHSIRAVCMNTGVTITQSCEVYNQTYVIILYRDYVNYAFF